MMPTMHFNKLSEAEQERLAILIEECAEVVQVGCKILRHGYESDNNGKLPETNRQQLQRELGDLLHALDRMETAADVSGVELLKRKISKPAHIQPYLHHQGETENADRS